MVNIAHEIECSKGIAVGKPMATDGWKSRLRGSSRIKFGTGCYSKQSKRQGG